MLPLHPIVLQFGTGSGLLSKSLPPAASLNAKRPSVQVPNLLFSRRPLTGLRSFVACAPSPPNCLRNSVPVRAFFLKACHWQPFLTEKDLRFKSLNFTYSRTKPPGLRSFVACAPSPPNCLRNSVPVRAFFLKACHWQPFLTEKDLRFKSRIYITKKGPNLSV
ncbi:hypothetical protein lbkm_3824 [Lachnospiraceae bacterium KM106-2]|nr:hypothetical protein lbkm_3824 [Lachnospiraceae bacterium KM106-2]